MMKRHTVAKVSLVILAVVVSGGVYFNSHFTPTRENFVWGINFSTKAAEHLELDWQEVFLTILDELKPEVVRIMTYWDEIEPVPGAFSWQDTDFQVQSLEARGIKTIMVVGRKQPRWPECHEPGWFQGLEEKEQAAAQLDIIRQVVNRYKDSSAVEIWQIENEPRFRFGPECDKTPLWFLREEIKLIKELDPSRNIMITDSGELGAWLPSVRAGADVFGSTMYRTVHDKRLGYVTYPLPPLYFRLKAGMLNTFARPQEIMGVELQAEPWFVTDAKSTELSEQQKLMNPEIFAENIDYAKKVGFERNYLWGVEWWYWMKIKQNDSSMWDAARSVIVNP